MTVKGLASDGSTTSQAETYTYYGASSPNAGMVASETDASGYTTGYAYNVANQLTTLTYPPSGMNSGSATLVYAYEYPGGPLTSQTLTSENGSQFEQVLYTYDAEGNLASETGSTYPVSYTYDALFRPLTMTEYTAYPTASEVTTYAYDPVGRLSDVYYPGWSVMSDPKDHWNYAYDKDDNLTVRTDGNGATTTYARDATLASLVDSISYGVKAGASGPGMTTGTVGFGYDGFERRTSMTDESGSKSATYSDIDLPLTATTSFTGGPQNQQITYHYDPDSSRGTMTPPLAPLSGQSFAYAYDGLSRLKQITAPFQNDDAQSRTAAQSVNYAYQANGWLMTMTQGVGASASDEETDYTYNGRGFLTTLFNKEHGTYVSQFDGNGAGGPMSYDAAGNRLGFTERLPGAGQYNGTSATRTVAYGYDTLGRNQLTSESSSITNATGIPNANYGYGYAYDDAGNPTTWKSTGSEFGFNTDNQVASVMSLTAPVYDGSGNPTAFSSPASTPSSLLYGGSAPYDAASASFSFDSENRLVGISSSSPSPSVSFSALYDGDGLRAQKSIGSTQTYFLYDGGQLLEEQVERGGSPALQSLYLTGADGVRARYNNDGQSDLYTFVYSYDPQGSLAQLQLTQNYYFAPHRLGAATSCYDGWGQLLGENLVSTGALVAPMDSVGFGGQDGYYQDRETGLYQLGARYYDAGKGRFVNRDPIGYGGGANLYGFCGNNPVTNSDPSGNGYEPIDEAIDAGLVAADIGQLAYDQQTHASQATINTDYVALGLDVAGLLPLVPPGAGHAYALVKGGEHILAAYKAERRAAQAAAQAGKVGIHFAQAIGDEVGEEGEGETEPVRVYVPGGKHGPTKVGNNGAEPKNGQAALDNSFAVKEETTTRRVGIDRVNRELVVLDETEEKVSGQRQFHGHVRSWDELNQKMQAVLRKTGQVSAKGKIK